MSLFNDLPEQRRPLKEMPGSMVRRVWTPPDSLPSLAGVKFLGLDVETKDTQLDELGPGVRRPGNFIAGISLALDEDGPRYYLPIRHEGGGNLDPNLVMNWAREELNKFDGHVVGANVLYDLDWLAEAGVTFPLVKRFYDVQNAEPLLDENRFKYGLEVLATEYLGESKNTVELYNARQMYNWKSDKQVKQNLWRLPAHLVGPYAEGDADFPVRILPLQLKKLREEDLLDLFDLETRLVPLLLAMRRRGVRVDVERAGVLRQTLTVKRDEVLSELRRLAGPKVELTVPGSIGPALEEAGVVVPRTPKTNQYSVTKELLEKYAHLPICSLFREGRKLTTIIGTFIDGHVFTHAINGRIHCTFHQLKKDEGGTIARFSSSDPNLQNIPARDDELAPLVRGMFVPEEDEEWVRHDLSQIEYRFLAHYAVGPGADRARERYKNEPGLSFHKMCGEMFGLTDMKGEVYKRIKNTNFCKVYGGGVNKLALTFNCSFEEAQAFSDRYDRELPFVTETLREAEKLARRRGWVKTILKRRRRFPFWEPGQGGQPPLPYEEALKRYGQPLRRAGVRNALNGMLQGGAADFIKKAMVDQWEAGVSAALGPPLVTVHDELDWSVARTPAAQEAIVEAKRLFEHAIRLRVPVVAEEDRGSNWGACS